MARRLTLRTGDISVAARLAMPAVESGVGVVLAHGAGAGQDHRWMVTMRDGLAENGLPTMTFNYAYADAGRKAPDRPAKLLAVHAAALARMLRYADTVILAGKSMGGRMASHLAAETDVAIGGLVYYGYPLVPLGKEAPRPTDHLQTIAAPQLFFCGTRDRLSPPALIVEVAAGLVNADVVVVDDADHSFVVPKRSGKTTGAVLAELAASTGRWVRRTVAADNQSVELGGV